MNKLKNKRAGAYSAIEPRRCSEQEKTGAATSGGEVKFYRTMILKPDYASECHK
ncbi:MAG TPA: hypothetical protein VGC97_03360 [Pyrinomonadaceae bacterium]|jgi:hypothetical protein